MLLSLLVTFLAVLSSVNSAQPGSGLVQTIIQNLQQQTSGKYQVGDGRIPGHHARFVNFEK